MLTMHPHLCIQCQRYFEDFDAFKRHLSRHKTRFASTPWSKLQPGLFRKKFRKDLEYVNLNWYKCIYCYVCIKGANNLVVHMKEHSSVSTLKTLSKHRKKKKKKKKDKKDSCSNGESPGEREYICKRCQSVFYTKMGLKVHKKTQCVKTVHKCDLCSQICDSQISLEVHHQTHYHSCTLCESIFTSESILRNHMRTHATVESPTNTPRTSVSIIPQRLSQSFASNQRLTCTNENGDLDETYSNHWPEFQSRSQNASDENQETELYPCDMCSHILSTEISWYIHRRAHGDVKNEHLCPCCEIVFTTSEKLNQHFCIHSEGKKNQCSFCRKDFTEISSLLYHEAGHLNGPSYEKVLDCELCHKVFSSPSALSKHARREHVGFRPFVCQICNKRYIFRSDLIRHHSSHTGAKPFKCSYCPKLFAHKKYLVPHERIHTGETPYQCTYCPKKFSSKDSLTYHERTHTGETPYICKVCHKGFKTGSALRYHEISTHGGEKSYECPHCKKQFIQKNDLTIHVRTHTGEKPYKCEVENCGKGFVSAQHLTRHTNRIHGSQSRKKNFKCKLCDKAYFEKRHLLHHELVIHSGPLSAAI